MNLNRIPSGEIVVIDANIFLYAIQKASAQCQRLLERVAKEEVVGILPLHTLAGVTHHLMMAEAYDNQWITAPNHARELREQPDRVRALIRYEGMVRDLLSIGLHLEPLQREDFLSAMMVQRQAGLLINEALLVAVGQRLRAQAIASTNSSFARVQGMLLYAPEDVE
ncbi:MAG: type II toxin-antitoxin system VapC family toxin [candidate division KSB1 bacterium]|nr:type II toxin-antitoxin system VapC family toxin [candidate division KSB1 bacterium]MDZ7367726.1 type II toxin-antitoxin system VapC family toxin [candidate division KSB1 bacterium]MDZ7406308.1 type II toxin-antitoxin system VapC family toxin [candidate division KSB1 bacterium]